MADQQAAEDVGPLEQTVAELHTPEPHLEIVGGYLATNLSNLAHHTVFLPKQLQQNGLGRPDPLVTLQVSGVRTDTDVV